MIKSENYVGASRKSLYCKWHCGNRLLSLLSNMYEHVRLDQQLITHPMRCLWNLYIEHCDVMMAPKMDIS